MDVDTFSRTRAVLHESLQSAETLLDKLERNSSNLHLKGDVCQLKKDMLKIYRMLLKGISSESKLSDNIILAGQQLCKVKRTLTQSKKYWQSESLYRQQKNALERAIRILSQVLDDLDALPKFDKNREEKASPKDLDVDQFSPFQEEDIWGCSPEHSDEVINKITGTQFSTLPLHKRIVCVTAASFANQRFTHDVRHSRKERKESEYYHDGFSSYLNKEELAMIGRLDGKEAEYIYKESTKHPYKHAHLLRLVDRYRDKHAGQGLKIPGGEPHYHVWFHSGKPFVDNDKVPDIIETEVEAMYYEQDIILGDKARRKLLEEGKRYLMKIEEALKLYQEQKI